MIFLIYNLIYIYKLALFYKVLLPVINWTLCFWNSVLARKARNVFYSFPQFLKWRVRLLAISNGTILAPSTPHWTVLFEAAMILRHGHLQFILYNFLLWMLIWRRLGHIISWLVYRRPVFCVVLTSMKPTSLLGKFTVGNNQILKVLFNWELIFHYTMKFVYFFKI